jgi:hypothetical protein
LDLNLLLDRLGEKILNFDLLLQRPISSFRWLDIHDGLYLGSSIARCSMNRSFSKGGMVTHSLVLAQSCDADVAYRCLELDQWMSTVVLAVWVGFAVGAEVGVVADSALVTHSLNVVVLALAEGTVTINANVTRWIAARSGNGLIESCKSMLGMYELGVLDAFGAVVPVWAGKALVANPEDWLVTTITEGSVLNVASWSTEELGQRAKSVLSNSLEGMCWVVTMLIGLVACNAEIEIIAINASHELGLSVF